MEMINNKCFYCKREVNEMLVTDCNEKICTSCLSKLILFNKNNFYANCNNEIELNCILTPDRTFNTTRNKICEVLKIPETYTPSNGIKCEEHDMIEDVYCNDCRQLMCEKCFDEHKKMRIFSKHKKGLKPEETIERCPNHTHKDLDYQCIDCEMPICEVCKSTKHNNHKLEYIKEYYDKKKEDILQNIKFPFKNLEDLFKDIKEKEDAVIESIKRESTHLVNNIEEMVDTLTTTKETVLKRSIELIENAKINFDIMRMNYQKMYYQLQNLNLKDYFNVNFLSKLPRENEIYKMDFVETLNEDLTQIKQIIKKFNKGNLKIIFSGIIEKSEEIKELLRLQGHTSNVSSLTILNDGKLASGSGDKTIKIWDTQTGNCIRTLEGHTNKVLSLSILNDGKLASGSGDKTIKIWDTQTGNCIRTLQGHTSNVSSLTILNDGKLASGSYDTTIKIWDTQTGNCIRTLQGHTGPVYSITLLNDGKLASGSYDTTIKIWDTQTGNCIRTLQGHTNYVYCLTLLNDGKLASGSYDTTIKIWDTQTGNCIRTLQGHTNYVYCLTLLNDGKLASGSYDNTIKIWG